MKKDKEYTPQALLFFEALKDVRNKGDLRTCMNIAGYSESTGTSQMVSLYHEEIAEIASKILAAHGAKAAAAMVNALDTPAATGNRELISAAKEILDRAGVSKKNQDGDVKIKVGGGIIVLPAVQKGPDSVPDDMDEEN